MEFDKSKFLKQSTKNINSLTISNATEKIENILKSVTQELIRNTLQCT